MKAARSSPWKDSMTLSTYRFTVARIQREVADLQRKQADEAKKVADATRKMNAAIASANKASSPSMAKSYLSTAERESKNVESAQEKQAQVAADIARKVGDLTSAQESVRTGEEKERKGQVATYDKQRREQAPAYEKQLKMDASSIKALQSNNDRLSRDLASLAAQMTAAASWPQLVSSLGKMDATARVHEAFAVPRNGTLTHRHVGTAKRSSPTIGWICRTAALTQKQALSRTSRLSESAVRSGASSGRVWPEADRQL